MNKILVSSVCFVFLVVLSGDVGAQPALVWAKSYDSGALDEAYRVAVDSQDNVIVTGRSDISGTPDFYTIKYDSNGNLLWAVSYDGGGVDWALGVTVDSQDNIIVTGFTHLGGAGLSDFLTIKYDPNGNQLWAVSYDSGGEDVAEGVAVDSNDNIIVTGYSGHYRVKTIKYDQSGNQLWTKFYSSGNPGGSWGNGVAVDSQDNVIVAGFSSSGYWYFNYLTEDFEKPPRF